MKRLLSLIISGLLLLGTVPAFGASKAPTGGEAQGINPSILDPLLVKEFEKGESQVPIVVYMKDTVDREVLASFPLAQGFDRYNTVVDGLKSSTFRAQQSLMKEISSEVRRGRVENVQSYYVANALSMTATREVAQALAERPDVEKVLFDRIIPLNDPVEVPSNRDVHKPDKEVEWNIARIGADVLWDEGITGKGITVGIIDTGVDGLHPALARKWKGYGQANSKDFWLDAVEGKPFPYDEPTIPHGSHVAGTILGSEEDGSNKIGVAPEAQWIAARAFTANGATMSALLSAGQFMLEKKPDIVNNSWGGAPGKDEFYRRVVDSWNAAGIISVFAAGNANAAVPQEPGSINAPANYLDVLAIGATDIHDQLGNFSLIGPTPYDPERIKPDLSAPGVNIRSSVQGGGYEDGWNGTSMAAPHIAGVLALMKQVRGGEDNKFYEAVLRNTAIPRTDARFRKSPNMGYGYGIVDAYAAVHSVLDDNMGTIQGTVMIPADQSAGTVISHQQLKTTGFISVDQKLTVRVTDPVAVTSVKAIVTQGETVKEYEMADITGDAQSGEYQVIIDSKDLLEGNLTYYFEAVNFNGDITKSENYEIELVLGVKPGEYIETFDEFPEDWLWMGDWEWGVPKKGPMSGYTGDYAMATKLEGKYSPSTASMLVTPPIDLRDVKSAYLSFEHWFSTPLVRDFDMAQIRITNDGGVTWHKTDKEWSGDGASWRTSGVNLSEFIGSETPVHVSFEFYTDIMDAGDGWFIDDVALKLADDEVSSNITGFVASEITINHIDLKWDPVADPTFDYYHLEKKNSWSGNYETVAKLSTPAYRQYNIYPGDTYEYRITAVNFAGKASPVPAELTVEALNAEKFFDAKFTSSWNPYFSSGGINSSWEYGEAEWDPENYYAPAKPLSSKFVWGTNLKGEYRKRSNSFIQNEYGFDIPAEGDSWLNFIHWYEIEDDNPDEYGIVQISIDNGETWTDLSKPIRGEKKYWHEKELSLNDYRGQENVLIRFTLRTDDLFQELGWYISSVTGYTLLVEDGANAIQGKTSQDEAKEGKSTREEAVESSKSIEALEAELEVEAKELLLTKSVQEAGIATEALSQQGMGPIEARLTMVETGRYANSSGRTGEFKMFHKAAEKLTLRAEAYGYESLDMQFGLKANEVQTVHFELKPKATNSVQGMIVDQTDKSPIVGATVRLREDANFAEVQTDSKGRFEIPNVYIGSYTLAVNHPDYREGELAINVLAQTSPNHYLELERFVGFEDQISYDDGSVENFIVLGPGAGNAVVFDTDEYVKVTGIEFLAGGEDWPVPGGTLTSVAIIRMDGNGKPLGLVGEPKQVHIKRGEWNSIDLSEYNFGTSSQFALAVVQVKENNLSPSVGIDTEGSNFVPSGRSFVYSSGSLQSLEKLGIVGNYLIRARVEKSLKEITIDNLNKTHYTSSRTLPVEGTVRGDCTVNLYLDGHLAATVDTKDKKFATKITMTGEHQKLTATAVRNGKETSPAEGYSLVYDGKSPELTVRLPWDNTTQSDRYLETTGRVFDENFDYLTIQDQPVEVSSTGAFRQERILSVGKNVISYKAYDKAGNMTEVLRTIMVQPASDFKVLTPLNDQEVVAGEMVQIEATTTQGTVEFQVSLSQEPLAGAWQSMTKKDNLFKGQWKVPTLGLGNYFVHFKQTQGDRETLHMAPGKLMVVNKANTLRIFGDTRYKTAVEIARTFETSETVYLVNGETFADSAVAGPLARQKKAPLLLTKKDKLPEDVLLVLEELKAKQVVIVGGNLAVSSAVETELKTAGLSVERIAGATRYETSIQVAKAMKTDGRFFLASGESLADAIATGSYGIPILLTPGKNLEPAVQEYLDGADEVMLLGGKLVLEVGMEKALNAKQVTRLEGATRFDTNTAVLNKLAGSAKRIVVANGMTLVDALTAAPLGIPVLLTEQNSLPNAAADYLTRSQANHLVILGGEKAISAELEQEIQKLLFY